MSRKKKIISWTVAMVSVFSLSLMGCGKDAGNTAKDESSSVNTVQSNSTVSSAESLPEVKLSLYYPGGEGKEDDQLVHDEFNKILKDKINATVDFQCIGAQYEEKMKVMMAASEEFDISFTSYWTNNYRLNASKGYYLPMDDLLKSYAPKLFSSMSENIWGATKVNGKIYAVPNQQIFARTSQLDIPKESAEKYGYSLADAKSFKLEEIEPYLDNFMKGEKDRYPLFINPWTVGDLLGYYKLDALAGGDVPGAIQINDTSLKVFNQFESDEFKQYLALMAKWKDKGYLKSKEIMSNFDQISTTRGKVCGAWFGGTWKPGVEQEETATYGTPMICQAISDFVLDNNGIIATMDAISRTSKNPERAMMLLELINTDEQLFNLMSWGIEGKHYTKKEGKYIEQIKDSKYSTIPTWELASTFNSYLLAGQPADIWEQTKKINKDAYASAALGFAFDPMAVKAEVSNCSAVIKEYDKGLSYGILSMDKDYPEFINKLKKAGSDKIIEEMQRQIDEWKKNQIKN